MLADAHGVSATLYAIAVLCMLALLAGALLPDDARTRASGSESMNDAVASVAQGTLVRAAR